MFRRYYWFEVLDDSHNVVLDTDGVGNALASILEDSLLQVRLQIRFYTLFVLSFFCLQTFYQDCICFELLMSSN
jgi:hypothetical protein